MAITASAPIATDPMQLLVAALSTERTELLDLFGQQIRDIIQSEEGMNTELQLAMCETIVYLAKEVYDARRTLRSIDMCEKFVEQAMRGFEKHLNVSREVRRRYKDGTLPAPYAAEDIITVIKEEMRREEDDE